MDIWDVNDQGNLGQTAVLSGGQWCGKPTGRKKEKCHFKSVGNGVRKRIGFLCLLLYVWTLKDIQIQGC